MAELRLFFNPLDKGRDDRIKVNGLLFGQAVKIGDNGPFGCWRVGLGQVLEIGRNRLLYCAQFPVPCPWKQGPQQQRPFFVADHCQVRSLLPEPVQAKPVEGADEYLLRPSAHPALQPLLEFVRGPIGKGDRRHPGRICCIITKQPGQPGDQGVGLAGARAGLDQDPAAGTTCRLLLLRVQPPVNRSRLFCRQRFRQGKERQLSGYFFLFFYDPSRCCGKQAVLAPDLVKFAGLEQGDHPELTVIPGIADHPAGADPGNRLGKHRRVPLLDLLYIGFQKELELGAEQRDNPPVLGHHPFGGRAPAQEFA